MYDIYIFKNIFSEGEMLAMTPQFIEQLGKLLDDKMSTRILEFFDRFETSGLRQSKEPIAEAITQKVDLMRELLGDAIRSNTFHLEVRERDALTFIETLTLETALSVIRDRDKAEYLLNWLLENRKYWRTTIDERRKEDYEVFLEMVSEFPNTVIGLQYAFQEVGYNVDIHYYDNVIKRVQSNKELFYAPNEKKRTTRMGLVMTSAPTMEAVLHGIRYQNECDSKKIRRLERRFF